MPTEEAAAASRGEDDLLRNDDPNTLRIMVSTDNHLGYAERDNVRGMDSFSAFEEVLYLAKRFNCDMVLLAGDLFHDNRPTRRTLHKTMEILRRYCMGPDPVQVQVLSSTSVMGGAVNYQDPNYAVQLPIFSIHGNHDDPSRDPGSRDLLAALDLLSVTNLINYFGRQEEVDKVEVAPILLQKGSTKVALYGLGSVRDERLNRMWSKDKVRFLRPPQNVDEDDDEEPFFNMFTLHQNRDLGRGNKNCVQESMIPKWMDIVVWGHEHECLIEWVESVVGTFRISQPGSSVATSLVSGEAQTKQVGILDIRGQNFRMKPIPLTQVRSFVTTEVSLREHRDNLDAEDPNVDKKVTKVLEEEVQLMILTAQEKRDELLRDALLKGNNAEEADSLIKYKLQKPDEVLVRIRVEHNGFTALDNQRFGAAFMGKVANPSEILLFHRRKDSQSASRIKKNGIEPIAPEELEQTNMEDLVHRHLDQPTEKLDVLEEKNLSAALEEYVDKSKGIAAIQETTAETLDTKQKLLLQNGRKGSNKANDTAEDESGMNTSNDVMDIDEEEEAPRPKQSTRRRTPPPLDSSDAESPPPRVKAAPKRKAPAKQKKQALDFSSDDDDDAPPVRRTAATRPSRRTAAKKKAVVQEPSDIEEILDDDDSYEKTARSTRKPAPKKKPAPSRQKKRRRFDDSDSDDDLGGLSAGWGTANTKSQTSDY